MEKPEKVNDHLPRTGVDRIAYADGCNRCWMDASGAGKIKEGYEKTRKNGIL